MKSAEDMRQLASPAPLQPISATERALLNLEGALLDLRKAMGSHNDRLEPVLLPIPPEPAGAFAIEDDHPVPLVARITLATNEANGFRHWLESLDQRLVV